MALETLTLDERATHRRPWEPLRPTDIRQPPLGLPNSQDSAGSISPTNSSIPHLYRGRRSPIRVDDRRFDESAMRGGPLAERRDDRNHSAPESPPYHFSDTWRPQLPPLKTLLGENISSPPRTPGSQGTPLQPSPKEPTYTTSTYKPLALYPNKKARMDLPHYPIIHSSVSSPGMPLAPLDRRASVQSTRPFTEFAHPATLSASGHTKQLSLQSGCFPDPLTGRTQYTEWPYESNNTLRQQEAIESASRCSSPDEKRGSCSSRSRSNFAVTPYEVRSAERCRSPSRRASVTGYGASGSFGSGQAVAQSSPDDRYNGYRRVDHTANHPGHASAPFSPNGVLPSSTPSDPQSSQSTRPAFFMPSPFDYQYGRARKRSNLPKQSTEIMKTWFDQNMTNPYPSEEQKAVFSNATGISMTQVSNWFINHRRRCPELRDKRDRGRNGKDDD